MKKTSIKDANDTIVSFVGNQQWGGFLIDSPRGCFEFANSQGPALALLALEASGWGNSNAVRVLYTLIETIETHPDYQTAPESAEEPGWFLGANQSKMRIMPKHVNPDRFRVDVVQGLNLNVMSPLRRDAPALALAILEAAGWTADDNGAINELLDVIEYQKVRTKEAADREALDAEAFTLFRAINPLSDDGSFYTLDKSIRSRYRRAALKARELHGVTA